MSISIANKSNFSVDRRPFFVYKPSPLGCERDGMEALGWDSRYGYDGGLEKFLSEFIGIASENGGRRFITMFPAGAVPNYGSANIYGPLLQSNIKLHQGEKSCSIDNPLYVWGDSVAIWKNYINHIRSLYGLSCKFFMGMSLMSPAGGFYDYNSVGAASEALGSAVNNPNVLSWLNYNGSGWKSAGVDGIAFYGVNQYSFYNPKLIPSIQSFLFNNLEMGCVGFGIPQDNSEQRFRLNDVAYINSPFVVRESDGKDIKAISGEWDVNKTEIHVIIPSSKINAQNLHSYFERGIIVGVEFDSKKPYEFSSAVKLVTEEFREYELRRIAKSKRNFTVFSMTLGDLKDSYGGLDKRYSSLYKSKANLSSNILPIIRVNCSSREYPEGPERLFIPSWWWSNNKSQCIDPSMSDQCLNSWMNEPFDKKMLLTSYKSPYGTYGPEKCADAVFDYALYFTAKYNALSDKPFSNQSDFILCLDNIGGGNFASEEVSGGLVDGECRIFGHPEDSIVQDGTYPALFDRASPFIDNGINECSEWLDRFMSRFFMRRSRYSLNGFGAVPPVPARIIFNNINYPSSSHMLMESVELDKVESEYGFKPKRNASKFYGGWYNLLKDSRFSSFIFKDKTLYDYYSESKLSGKFDVNATLPDSRGSSGSFGLDDARTDKDGLFYQPNAPARMWFDNVIKDVVVYGISEAVNRSVRNYIPGIRWTIPNLTITNYENKRIYNLSGGVCSDFICLEDKDLSYGGISSPKESRMHPSRLVMPGLHEYSIPKNSSINCFDIINSSIIKDGSFLPLWGAGYNRPIVGVAEKIEVNSNYNNIILNEDRSSWADASGSIFSAKDASSSNEIRSGKPIKGSGHSNDALTISSTMTKANIQANKNNIVKCISFANRKGIECVPFIMGTASADSSWDGCDSIGNLRNGNITGSISTGSYRIDQISYGVFMESLFSEGCSIAIHDPCSHCVNDWNAIEHIVDSINKKTNITSNFSSSNSLLDFNLPSSINTVSDYSHAIAISYDYDFANKVLQSNSRPYLSISRSSYEQGTFSLSLIRSDSSFTYSFKSLPIRDLRAIDLVNLLSKQDGLIVKILNGNSNVMLKDLVINDFMIKDSGWIFLSMPASSKNSPVSSEARSRPLDYLKVKNTTIDPVVSQSNPSMNFGGHVAEENTFEFFYFASPVYISSKTASISNDISKEKGIISSNGEMIRFKKIDEKRIELQERGMFGTRRKMHIPGDYAIYASDNIFDSRFGTEGKNTSQYRCFAMKNVSQNHICHGIVFEGVSSSSSYLIEMAIEVPAIQFKKIIVNSAGKNFIQSFDIESVFSKNQTLIGSLCGFDMPRGKIAYRSIDHIDGNKIYFSKSLPYIPHSNSYVDCHGSKAGYSPGGLIYPTPSGNKMSDFKSVMLNDEVSVNDIHGSDIALKPGQFFYLWIRRVVLPGVKNVSGENFMPKFKFEVS